MTNIVLTPVNIEKPTTLNGKKARIDYLREKEHSNNFSLPVSKWDDSKYNKAEIGDYFGFVQNKKDIIEIFRINDIIQYQNRPEYWDIEEHKKRNVLILSQKIGEMSLFTYFEENGYNTDNIIQGTTRMRFRQ